MDVQKMTFQQVTTLKSQQLQEKHIQHPMFPNQYPLRMEHSLANTINQEG